MKHQQHSFAGRLLKKSVSVTLAVTMLLSMVMVGNVFGTTAFAAETKTEGDYTYVVLDNGTARITKYSGTEAQLTVAAALGGAVVSEIGENAFENNDEIESVTFPEGIVTIGKSAFAGCDLLESISFAPTVTTIGKEAFCNCRALQSVDIPSTVKTIGDNAFSSCPILTDIALHEGLKSMGNRFLSGTAVSEIYIPATVTYANEAFAGMELLETVSFAEGITAIPEDMFEDNSSIRSLTIPSTVTKLGRDSLAQMSALESIVIPDNVTELGDYVLYQCTKLSSVTIGKGVTALPDNAFEGCTNLKSITIPSNVAAIGTAAFKDCSRLENVTLNEGLENIGAYSFERTAIKNITIPASVKKGSYPFNSCSGFTSVSFAEGTDTLVEGMFQNTALASITIPEGVTALPSSLFKGCQKLTEVNLPSTLRTIGSNAFTDCTALTGIDIPKSVKTISNYAFARTTSLSEFTLHEGIQTMESNIFEGSALTSIYIPKTLSSTSAPFANSNITDVTFSDGIATLTDKLFKSAKKLTTITIPSTVIKIGSDCFEETNIDSIVIPDNVKTIGSGLFYNCDNLYAVKIGAGVRKLPHLCFAECDVLQNVIIPETVYDMESSVFENTGLISQKLPQSLTYISSMAFKDCKKLTTVECSDKLESIGDYAFERCENFTTLTTSVKSVDFNNTTFKDCPKFKDKRFIVFNASNTGIESTGNIGTDHTLVHFTAKYDIRDDWADSDIVMNKLYLSFPDNLDIVTNSFSADGFAFDNAEYTGDFKSFDLTGAKTKGALRFSAYVNSSNSDLSKISAEVELRYKGTYFRKPLGEVQFTTAKLSLFAPSSVTEPRVTVSGYSASGDKDVKVYISRLNSDGSKDCTVSYTVKPNKYTGKYISGALNIVPNDKVAADEDVFEVYAECSGRKSDTASFTYTPGALKVVKATETVNIKKFTAPYKTNLSHDNQSNTYDITGIFTQGTSPVVMINPAEMLQFKLDLENDETIEQLVLISHKGSDWRFMQLFYDAQTDMWIGEGYFNIPDHELVSGYSYVPGALNLYYVRGERKDTYKSHYYGTGKKSAEAVGEPDPDDENGVFYYDANGKPHGKIGDYNETAKRSIIKVIVDLLTGKWHKAPAHATTGGLQTLWEWGVTNDNGFAFLHGGNRIGRNGEVILKGDDLYNRDPSKSGKQRNAIDPSGVIYEAVKGNPVEGATATLYKLNEDTSEWEEWNAADYEQQNPLLTNSEGAYAWLTEEGKFKVTVSKDGYETQTSEEFDVPPEKLDLDFSLVDNTTHPTATVTKDEETGSFTVKFSKFMDPATVTADSIEIEGLTDATIEPVYLNEGDEYADTFVISGTQSQKKVTFKVTEAAQSYSGVSAEASAQTIGESIILGDADGSGRVDINDATVIQKYVARYTLSNTESILAAGDVNGDDKVTIDDATYIQKYLARYELPYAIGKPIA